MGDHKRESGKKASMDGTAYTAGNHRLEESGPDRDGSQTGRGKKTRNRHSDIYKKVLDGFSRNLNVLLEKDHISQVALSKKLRVSKTAVNNWANGVGLPETDYLVVLADMFGVTTDFLLQREDMNERERKRLSYTDMFWYVIWMRRYMPEQFADGIKDPFLRYMTDVYDNIIIRGKETRKKEELKDRLLRDFRKPLLDRYSLKYFEQAMELCVDFDTYKSHVDCLVLLERYAASSDTRYGHDPRFSEPGPDDDMYRIGFQEWLEREAEERENEEEGQSNAKS